MKTPRKLLALTLVLIMALGMTAMASAALGNESGFDALPAGTYTYVSETPTAEVGSNAGQVQYRFGQTENNLVWAFGATDAVQTGVETITGDELDFFKGMYLSDRPVTDWLGGALKDTEGYAGDVAGNVKITLTENGKISKINVASPTTRVTAVLSQDITDTTLTVQGSTRGKPNLLQSCITLLGSTNALYLTVQGDVILDGLTIGNDGAGIGLTADKIGGDTFVAGTVAVDGKIEWHNKMGVITALESQPGTLITNGYDISMTGGSNIGRVGRIFNISTGEGEGDIILGAEVTTDSTRGGLLPNADTSADRVTISDTGSITAGLGDVIIGTNTEKAVNIDVIGNIQGANVIIKPTANGVPANVVGWIGNITATENIEIEIGTVNSGKDAASVIGTSTGMEISKVETGYTDDASARVIGNLTAESGNISFVAGAINGVIGDMNAPNGTVNLDIENANNILARTVSVEVDGEAAILNGYLISGQHYFQLDDLADIVPALEGKEPEATAYSIGDNNYYKMRDIASTLDFGVDWDGSTETIIVDTSKGYTP